MTRVARRQGRGRGRDGNCRGGLRREAAKIRRLGAYSWKLRGMRRAGILRGSRGIAEAGGGGAGGGENGGCLQHGLLRRIIGAQASGVPCLVRCVLYPGFLTDVFYLVLVERRNEAISEWLIAAVEKEAIDRTGQDRKERRRPVIKCPSAVPSRNSRR